jgi:hypothetical protein
MHPIARTVAWCDLVGRIVAPAQFEMEHTTHAAGAKEKELRLSEAGI